MPENDQPRFKVQHIPDARWEWLVRDTLKQKTVKAYKSLRCAHKRAEKENAKWLTKSSK